MHTFIYEYMMDLVAPLVAPALSQKPAFVTYFVARGAPRPCYIPKGFDSLPYIYASTYIIYLSLCVSGCLRVSLCASVFLRVSLCVSVCLSDYLSVCPSVCLSVSLALSVSLSRRSQGGRTLHASHACGPQVVDSTKDLSCGGSAGRVAQLCIFSFYRKGFSADSKARRNNLATPQDLCLSLSHCLSVSGSLRQTKGKLVRLSGKTLWARGHRSLRSRANAT